MAQTDLLRTYTCYRCGRKFRTYRTIPFGEKPICDGHNCFDIWNNKKAGLSHAQRSS